MPELHLACQPTSVWIVPFTHDKQFGGAPELEDELDDELDNLQYAMPSKN